MKPRFCPDCHYGTHRWALRCWHCNAPLWRTWLPRPLRALRSRAAQATPTHLR
jgi:hypothetical protein